MEHLASGIVEYLHNSGYPKIAKIWGLCLQGGCAVYVFSDAERGFRDGYALYWLSRLLPPTPDIELHLVRNRRGVEKVSPKNLIIIGRLWSFGDDKWLSNIVSKAYLDRHFHFLDNQKLLNIATGEVHERYKSTGDIDVRNYAVLRMWRRVDTGGIILNLAGLGAMGTLGAAISLAAVNGEGMRKMEDKLSELPDELPDQVEILIEVMRKSARLATNDTELKIDVLEVLYEGSGPKKPVIYFERTLSDEIHPYQVVLFDADRKIRHLLTSSQVETAVLAAIAQHTGEHYLDDEDSAGFIEYSRIIKSDMAARILKTELTASEASAAVSRIRKTLGKQEWLDDFPNLLLESNMAHGRKGRKKTIFRLRATPEWDPSLTSKLH